MPDLKWNLYKKKILNTSSGFMSNIFAVCELSRNEIVKCNTFCSSFFYLQKTGYQEWDDCGKKKKLCSRIEKAMNAIVFVLYRVSDQSHGRHVTCGFGTQATKNNV